MVRRITALAEIDQQTAAGEPMRERARAGDRESAWMVEQWDVGSLMLARVVLSAYAEDGDGASIHAEHVIEGVWLERDDPPGVEQQVADVAPAELDALAEELRGRGVTIAAGELEASFVHVELGAALRAALSVR